MLGRTNRESQMQNVRSQQYCMRRVLVERQELLGRANACFTFECHMAPGATLFGPNGDGFDSPG